MGGISLKPPDMVDRAAPACNRFWRDLLRARPTQCAGDQAM